MYNEIKFDEKEQAKVDIKKEDFDERKTT